MAMCSASAGMCGVAVDLVFPTNPNSSALLLKETRDHNCADAAASPVICLSYRVIPRLIMQHCALASSDMGQSEAGSLG